MPPAPQGKGHLAWELLNSHSLAKAIAAVMANIQVCLPDATPGSQGLSESLLPWERVPVSPGLVGEQKPLQNVVEALGN